MADDHKIKLLEKIPVAKDTMAFHFSKPEGFSYRAGQTMDLTLMDPPETDSEGNSRTFTIASAPFESFLMIATRMRDTAFKRVLKNAPENYEIAMEGPFGSFSLPNSSALPIVFLTGGIGITPARTIISQATHGRLPHKIYLFYSNHTPREAAFLDELKDLEKRNSNFKFIPVMTQLEDSSQWDGEKGHIDSAMLARHIEGGISNPIYFLSGPADMVASMRTILTDAGVDEDNIRTEEFTGY